MAPPVVSPGGVTVLPIAGRRLRQSPVDVQADAALRIAGYVAGPENRLVAATVDHLLSAASGGPRVAPSPLLLVGPSGCGKTHLAHGLAQKWHAELGPEAVAYLSASDFSRQVATAINDHTVSDFRRQLRRRRLLVIDDLDHLSGQAYVVDELVHTLAALSEQGGMLLATSRKTPADLPRWGRSLASRLVGGATLTIATLGPAAREELLRLALAALGRKATPDALALLAPHTPADAPGLFTFATQVGRQVRRGAVVDTKLAAELVSSGAGRKSPPAKEIIARVAKYYGLPVSKLTSANRQQTTVLARAVAIYLIRQLTPLSYEQIGRLVGGRDHTTVLYNYRRIEKELPTNRLLREALDELQGSIASQPTGP